jgi:AraC-like DNA-binding protein
MPRAPAASRFPVSLFATPGETHQDVFYTVPRAGHLVAGPDHHIRRDHFPGHEWILCLRGKGWVRVAARTHEVAAGHWVWINCHQPHEHGAHPVDPWEVLWIRTEGPRLVRLAELHGVAHAPVFVGFDSAAAVPLYREIFRLMQSGSPDAPAFIHAAVARLLALAVAARQRLPDEPAIPPVLDRAVQHMKLFYFQRHRVDDLAAMSGLSATHFSRLFKNAFGTSPIDWLRRERISQAKRRLAETRDAVKEIAAQVGYADPFFFSKDFKHLTGFTPGAYRRRENPVAPPP